MLQSQTEDLAQPIPAAGEALDFVLNPRSPLPGFALPSTDVCEMTTLPPSFIDRCRRAYLSIPASSAGHRVIGVTSAMPGEGKTLISVGMATAMAADTGARTVLLEADFERASVYKRLGFEQGLGLSDWLDGKGALRLVRSARVVNMFVLPGGAPRAGAARLFYLLNACGLMNELRERFANIVVDLPPVLDIAYGSLASSLADNLLLIARYGATLMADLEKVSDLLGRERISGVILNATEYRTPAWLRRLL